MNEIASNDKNIQKSNNNIESLPANSSWWTFFVKAFFGKNYCCFKGRASRKEYWGISTLWVIFSILADISLLIIMMATGKDISLASMLVSIYGILPQWSLAVRRFHDINMSAWWMLAIIPIFFLPFFKGDRKDNKYGKTIYSDTK